MTRTSAGRVAAAPALAMGLVLLASASRYDFHGDELYFRMLPPAWWYDDQPPLTVWLSGLAAQVSDAVWVQRLPAIAAAMAGVVLAAYSARVGGYGKGVQRVAAWAHASTVYPLLMGHVFLTSAVDLVAWQGVILCVLAALRGRRRALVWAGVVAGVACWNKLLVLVLLAALAVALVVVAPRLLRTRHAFYGALACAVIGGPQVLAQAVHGWPMSQVSGDLIARHGAPNRLLVLPLLVAFLGPPFFAVWLRGLRWRPPAPEHPRLPAVSRETATAAAGSTGSTRLVAPVTTRALPVLALAGALLVAWTMAFPAQPYYAVAAFLPALALGWGAARECGSSLWAEAPRIIAANAAVSLVLCLPLAPLGSPAFDAVAAAIPVARDQAGWPGYVRQLAAARGGPDAAVVTDSYALAGAAAQYGPAVGLRRGQVASGHNALGSLGPPQAGTVLLVGPIARTHRRYFARCEDAGNLRRTESDPFAVAGSPMARCEQPIGGWAAVWPHFRRLGG